MSGDISGSVCLSYVGVGEDVCKTRREEDAVPSVWKERHRGFHNYEDVLVMRKEPILESASHGSYEEQSHDRRVSTSILSRMEEYMWGREKDIVHDY